MVLMEQRHHVEHGHAWDQFGENAEILGREPLLQFAAAKRAFGYQLVAKALLACSLPAEHQAQQCVRRLIGRLLGLFPLKALTQTVVRLLRHRMATLPDFLDTVCCGVCGTQSRLGKCMAKDSSCSIRLLRCARCEMRAEEVVGRCRNAWPSLHGGPAL